jgi:hypothetical protein
MVAKSGGVGISEGYYELAYTAAPGTVVNAQVFSGKAPATNSCEYVASYTMPSTFAAVTTLAEIVGGGVAVSVADGVYVFEWDLKTSSGYDVVGSYTGVVDRVETWKYAINGSRAAGVHKALEFMNEIAWKTTAPLRYLLKWWENVNQGDFHHLCQRVFSEQQYAADGTTLRR